MPISTNDTSKSYFSAFELNFHLFNFIHYNILDSWTKKLFIIRTTILFAAEELTLIYST